jgi:hypothetical protein
MDEKSLRCQDLSDCLAPNWMIYLSWNSVCPLKKLIRFKEQKLGLEVSTFENSVSMEIETKTRPRRDQDKTDTRSRQDRDKTETKPRPRQDREKTETRPRWDRDKTEMRPRQDRGETKMRPNFLTFSKCWDSNLDQEIIFEAFHIFW